MIRTDVKVIWAVFEIFLKIGKLKISKNKIGDRGCGIYSESGLEHNNKYLRYARINLSRKQDQDLNMEDCITRLWLQSEPSIRNLKPRPHCKRCKKEGHFTVSCPEKMQPTFDVISYDAHYLSILLG